MVECLILYFALPAKFVAFIRTVLLSLRISEISKYKIYNTLKFIYIYIDMIFIYKYYVIIKKIKYIFYARKICSNIQLLVKYALANLCQNVNIPIGKKTDVKLVS